MTFALRRNRALRACFVLLGLASVVAVATLPMQPAHAASPGGVTSVTITEPMSGIAVGESVYVQATWQAGDLSAGDSFELALPAQPRFEGISSTFSLTTDAQESAGECSVDTTRIVCTLNTFVDTHEDVQGSLYFWAMAQETFDGGTVSFETDGRVVFNVPLPGDGKIAPEGPDENEWFDVPLKDGTVNTDASINWSVYIPGALMLTPNGDAVTMTDTFDDRLELVEGPWVYWVTEDQWMGPTPWDYDQFLGASEYSLAHDAGSNQFSITLDPQAVRTDVLYIISYRTSTPVTLPNGTVLSNTAEVSGSWSTTASVTSFGAGGDAGGTPTRPLTLTKRVTGATVEAGATFEFSVVCERDGVTTLDTQVTLQADQTVSLGAVSVDSMCTIIETDTGGASSVSFVPGSSFPVDATSQDPLAVIATNLFSDEPTEPVLPVDPIVPAPLAVQPEPTPPALAHTGAAAPTLTSVVAAGTLILTAGIIAWVRGRRVTRDVSARSAAWNE